MNMNMKFFLIIIKILENWKKKLKMGILGVMKNFGKKNKIVKYFIVKK